MLLYNKSLFNRIDNKEENDDINNNRKRKNHLTKSRIKEVTKKTAGDVKWRWRGNKKLSVNDRFEMNKKRRVMRYFHGAKSDKISKLSSSRLLAYGVEKKKKRK